MKKGIFKKVPDVEWVEADKADVEAGLAKCVGDSFKPPTVVVVMNDGSFTGKNVHKQREPLCMGYLPDFHAFKISDCSKEEDFILIARCGEIICWNTQKYLQIYSVAREVHIYRHSPNLNF